LKHEITAQTHPKCFYSLQMSSRHDRLHPVYQQGKYWNEKGQSAVIGTNQKCDT